VSWSGFEDFHKRWCAETSKARPAPEEPGGKPTGMTPDQEEVWETQQQPQNDWELHPDIDGCEPEPEPPG